MIKFPKNIFTGSTKLSFRPGFTLIELLVVIAIIVILLSILIPSLAMIKERSRRIVCRSNVHQFIIGLHVYATSNDDKLISGMSENGLDEHTPVLSPKTRQALIDVVDSHKTLMCPWLGKPFNEPDGWHYPNQGYVIGYNYLGGHMDTPWEVIAPANTEWVSPKTVNESATLEIVTELNAWSSGDNKTFAPHGRRGAILEAGDSTNPSAAGITSQQIGAVGGNVGLLDGSVSWKKIEEMKIYRGSKIRDQEGCFATW